MPSHTPHGVALQARLCSKRVERITRLRDLSHAEEWGEQINDRLDLLVAFGDPLERVDTTVTFDPAHPSECAS